MGKGARKGVNKELERGEGKFGVDMGGREGKGGGHAV